MRSGSLELKDALKTYRHDQDKTITPRQTVEYFRERLRLTGLDILEDVVRIDNGRLGIPIYFSLCGKTARVTIGNIKQMGKGATPEQSQASAVMELGERFSLFSFNKNPDNFVFTTYKSLQHPAMGFDQIALSVQDESDDLPEAKRFFEELPMQWTPAHNLTRRESALIPFNWFWAINEFNGSSAGNCVEEALCQGICEVVERHVSAVVSREKRAVPGIKPSSITDPVAQELLQRYNEAGVKVYLSDFTCDMGIPSIGVLAWDPTTFPVKSEIVWTAGTSPQPAKALCRALTEAAQLAGDFNSGGNYEASGLPKFRNIEEADFITRPNRRVGCEALPDLDDVNIKIEIERCVQALAKRNREVWTVDIRHPQLDIPAFYTNIPGMLFRERAIHGNVALVCAKIVVDSFPADKALKLLKQYDQRLPHKYFIQFYLGQILMGLGQFDEAQYHFSYATELEPPDEDLASIYTYLGLSYKQQEQYRDALDALKLAARIDPERTDTLNLMGFCYFKLKSHEAAIECFSRIVSLNPSSAIDYANLAVNYRALRDDARAAKYYQLALSLDPDIDFAREHLEEMGIAIPE